MTDTVLTYLDSYCERAGNAALMAEPLNAVTNLFFIAAAALVARAIVRDGRPAKQIVDLWLLAASLFGIGLGSGAWHLAPSGTTVLMDVIPITIFINVYIIASLRRLFGLSWPRYCWAHLIVMLLSLVILITINISPWLSLGSNALGSGIALACIATLLLQLYLVRNTAFGYWELYTIIGILAQIFLPADLLNGTIMYIPTYATLVVMTFALAQRDREAGKVFAIMTTLWSLSLIFRTIDTGICQQLAVGTHFLWHTFNAVVLWRLSLVLIRKTA